MPDQHDLPEEWIESLAKLRWEEGWFDDQGMARWDQAKRMGLPAVQEYLDQARAHLKKVAPAIRAAVAEEERERLREAVTQDSWVLECARRTILDLDFCDCGSAMRARDILADAFESALTKAQERLLDQDGESDED